MPDGFKRIVWFERGHLCERYVKNPADGGSHGRKAMRVAFILVGPEGAIELVVCTGWFQQDDPHSDRPHASELVYHHETAPETADFDDCAFIGGPCAGDVTYNGADPFLKPFLKDGPGGLWPLLHEEYDRRVKDGN